MLNTIKEEYNNLSDLEKKALHIGCKMILSEISKTIILILIFLFLNLQIEFLFATVILLPLRCNMGGLHFHTYHGCLIATFTIFASSILLFPNLIVLNDRIIILILLICLTINLIIGPVINPTRPQLTPDNITKIKTRVFIIFMVYIVLIHWLLPNNYKAYGTWIITEQTLQLIFAKIRRKRRI